MEVWDESNDRRSDHPRRGRIRRFTDWKDFALFLAEILGGAAVIGGFVGLLLTSLGFKVSGSGQAIAAIEAANVVRDTRITKIEESQPVTLYMICGLYSKQFPQQVPALCDKAISRMGARP